MPETKFKISKRGTDLLSDPALNKGSAFTREERIQLGLVGLLPPHIATMEEQSERILENMRAHRSDLGKHVEMIALLDRNETLFYRVVMDNIDEMLPIIYTPVVGRACQLYGHLFRRARGIFISRQERGMIRDILKQWPRPNIRVIVVTDGERILGLGDLGANGMGIPIGKLSLYTACAGVDPAVCLPVMLDTGTNNKELLEDPLYIGTRETRLTGAPYDELVHEFITAAQEVFPGVLIQFEDFGNHNAFRLLEKYQSRSCVFNDDIEGTAAVALAGLYGAGKVTHRRLPEEKILFCGAGEAAIGIGNLTVRAMMEEGLSKEEAMSRCWFMDSKGLIESSRKDLQEHKKPYAHKHAPVRDLAEAVKALKPTALIGGSGKPGQFTQTIIEEMSKINKRPIISALSNPTSNAECTAEEAYTHSGGRALFASGSPFAPVTLNGKTFVPGQGNNAYIFPGMGLGIVAGGITRVTEEMFLESARVLASCVTPEDLDRGQLYPGFTKVRQVSALIAEAIIRKAQARGLAAPNLPKDLTAHVRSFQYEPVYKTYTAK